MKFLIAIFSLLFLTPIDGISQENWKMIGNNLMMHGDVNKALEAYQNYLEFYPDDFEVYLSTSKIHVILGDNIQARKDLKLAQSLNPFSKLFMDEARRAANIISKKYGYYEEDKLNAFKKSPLNTKYYQETASNGDLNKTQETAIYEILEHLYLREFLIAEDKIKGLELKGRQKAILYDLEGIIYLKLERYEDAIVYFNKAIEADSLFEMAYHNRAICHYLLDEPEKAVEDLETALGQDNSIAIFYFTLANILDGTGSDEEALIAYDNALALDNTYLEALTNSAYILQDLGELSKSRILLNQVIDMNPDKVESDFKRGNLNFTYGEFDKAIINYNEYLKKVKITDPAAYFNRGLSKILMGDKTGGCLDISNSIEMDPDNSKESFYFQICKSSSSATPSTNGSPVQKR